MKSRRCGSSSKMRRRELGVAGTYLLQPVWRKRWHGCREHILRRFRRSRLGLRLQGRRQGQKLKRLIEERGAQGGLKKSREESEGRKEELQDAKHEYEILMLATQGLGREQGEKDKMREEIGDLWKYKKTLRTQFDSHADAKVL